MFEIGESENGIPADCCTKYNHWRLEALGLHLAMAEMRFSIINFDFLKEIFLGVFGRVGQSKLDIIK